MVETAALHPDLDSIESRWLRTIVSDEAMPARPQIEQDITDLLGSLFALQTALYAEVSHRFRRAPMDRAELNAYITEEYGIDLSHATTAAEE